MSTEAEGKSASPSGFNKKVYRKLDSSPISKNTVSDSLSSLKQSSSKKIISTSSRNGLREDFKKMFLPLLIDIFELRQMIENYKVQSENPSFTSFSKVTKTPREILTRLEQLQQEIEESQRWCEGVILQIAKGIKEAKEALDEELCKEDQASHSSEKKVKRKKKFSFWKKILKK